MNTCRQQVAAAIRATAFHSTTAFSWFGKRSAALPAPIKRTLTAETARNYLLFSLQSRLYSDFYCSGAAMPARQDVANLAAAGRTPFVEALSAANCGHGYWADGWEVRAIDQGQVAVCADGLEVLAHVTDCSAAQDGSLAPGSRVRVRFPKELLRLSPGFYMALGGAEFARDSAQSLLRLYWNLRSEGAIDLVQHVTAALNQAGLPFKLKVLNEPAQFTRCDAGVLYIHKNDYGAVSAILERVYPKVCAHLRQETPVFTKWLAPGLGLAEDPGQGDSFGLHRCQLVAEGMLRAYEQGKQSPEERLNAVADRFTAAGISLDAPFLNPGSSDGYTFHLHLRRQQLSRRAATAPQIDAPEGAYLRTAHEIGQSLAREALWYGDRCNWLGAWLGVDTIHSPTPGRRYPTYRALGSDLYGGTSGVALFLAELSAATGDALVRRTALGAIRHALWHVEAQAPTDQLGAYGGWLGVAIAAARMATALGEDALLERAAHLLDHFARRNRDGHEFDLLSGSAGAVVALLILHAALPEASLIDDAVELGDELLHAAEKSPAGYSWPSPRFPKQRNLTGFSHGAAGVGYALLELFRVTAAPDYRKAADMAFRYERHWFDADARNWPDFREDTSRGERTTRALSFATYWCHGAAGIALSRLRAYDILHDESYKEEALIALQTTRTMIEAALETGIGNFSLCHGLSGNADVLLYGSAVLGREWPDGAALARAVANFGIATYAQRGHDWPCGTLAGETPALLLGLAGIGHFYLRLHNPALPSILLLHDGAGTRGESPPLPPGQSPARPAGSRRSG